MKQSALQSQRNERPEVTSKNRVRLIQQNKKLLIEVYKLESIINNILERSASNGFSFDSANQESKKKYKEEIQQQLKHMARLKKEIKIIKVSMADHQQQQIKKQQNQLIYLKRQYEKILRQRDTMQKKKNQKQQALEFHKSINNQTAETYEHYKKVKAQNGQLKLKMHHLQKQIAKYHKYKELAKGSVPKLYDNPDYEFMKIDNEVKEIRKEMKRIEEKWKGKLQSLNREYFSFRNIFIQKEAEIQNLQKEARNWESKMNSKRDQILVASDRQRISSVSISPQKRKEMQDLIEQQKKKLKRLEPKSNITKNKNQKSKPESLKATVVKDLPVIKEIAVQTEKPRQQAKLESQIKIEKQENKVIQQKPKKMVQSVGVGTSFYYSDD